MDNTGFINVVVAQLSFYLYGAVTDVRINYKKGLDRYESICLLLHKGFLLWLQLGFVKMYINEIIFFYLKSPLAILDMAFLLFLGLENLKILQILVKF